MLLLSNKIARLIEECSDQIVDRWLAEIQVDAGTSSLTGDRRQYARARFYDVLRHISDWIGMDTKKDEVGRRYAREGIQYFKARLPLCELIRSLAILKRTIIAFSIDECAIESAYELYLQNELKERINVFFDQAIYYLSRGYMEEMSRAMQDLWGLSDAEMEQVFFKKSFYHKQRDQTGGCLDDSGD